MVQLKSALGRIPVGRAMTTDFRMLSPRDSLARAVDELILTGPQQDVPVLDNGYVAGVLTRGDLLTALPSRGQGALVADVMRRDCRIVDSFKMLETAFARLQECACHTLPVTHGGRLVGLVTMDSVGEFLAIQTALAPTRRL